MNPDFTNDPDDNFSILESIRGFLSPKPLSSPYRHGDLRLYIDSLGRPDAYALNRLNRQRLEWNQGIEDSTLRLKRVFYPVELPHPATKRTPAYTENVLYDYLQIVRGKQAVAQIDQHLQNMTNGIEDVRTDLQQCANIKNVDTEIQRVLQENRDIENGRGA